jgi:hypothetical protein
MDWRLEYRDIVLILIVLSYFAIANVYADATQDAIITVADNGAGVCMGADSPNNVVCANETFNLEGTQDHVIYITPGAIQAANSSYVKRFDDYVIKPIGLFFIIVFPIIGILVLYMVLRLAWRVI